MTPSGPESEPARRDEERHREATIEQLTTKVVYRNDWMTVREDGVRFANGTEGIFGVVEKQDFAVVLPYENDGFWLVEQFRYPVGKRVWEFPLGAWAAGAPRGTLAELAALELREETGFTADSLVDLGRLHTAPGVQDNEFHAYLATGLTAGSSDLESTESDLRTAWFTLTDIRRMIVDGIFADAQSVAALTLFDIYTTRT